MKNLYSNLLSVLKNIIAIALCLFSFNFIDAQCIPSGMVPWNSFAMENITIEGDNSTTEINYTDLGDNFTNAEMYTDNTSLIVEMTAGGAYTFSITHLKETWGNLKVRIWIDYGSGVFSQIYDDPSYSNNSNTTQTSTGTINIPAGVSGLATLRVATGYFGSSLPADGCNFIERAEVHDYTVDFGTPIDPAAGDDSLSVLVNSTSGTDNQINVSFNDNIGSSDGSDSEDFSLTSTTPTVNGGIITEVSDGIFEYIPAANYVGTDSFTYQICDAGNDCASATVNVNIGFNYCTPTSSSTDSSSRNLYITNVFLDGEGAADINNTTGDDGGYGNYTSIAPADVFRGSTYSITINSDSNPTWVYDQVLWSVFLDLNADGDFDDTGETLYQSTNQETRPYSSTITIPSSSVIGTTVMRVAIEPWNAPQACSSSTAPSEHEDYLINIQELDTPTASNDDLSVLVNSTSSIDNQIDVSTNDTLGSDGGDTNNYTLTSASPTANGGTIMEISDGVFQYVPATDYAGSDSFTYEICDAGAPEDCVTATVNVSVNFGHCIPTSNSNGTQYLENVTINGELSTLINNTSGDNGGYADFTGSFPALILYKGGTYSISATGYTQNSWERLGWSVYIDLNGDGDFEDVGERVYDTNGTETTTAGYSTFASQNISIPTSVITGYTAMRVGTRRYHSASKPCGNTDSHTEEFEDYLIDFQIDPSSAAEMDITANNTDVLDGATTTSQTNLTDFGVYDIYTATPLERTFTITNNGGANLNLIGTPRVDITGSSDFSISIQPAVTTIAGGSSTTFVVAFSPSAPTIGVRTATISIANDDSNENPYTFLVEGYGDQTFPDTDEDGIPDNVDLDDDNDGLIDEYEQNSCLSNPGATTTTTVYLNEDFEAGTNRGTIDGVAYCWEDGTGSCNSTPDLGDGEYAVYYKAANGDGTNDTPNGEVASWADVFWYPGLDHTPGDTNGRMAMFNADFDPGLFYKTTIVGVSPGVDITYGFSAINLDRADAPGIGSRIRPNVLIEILDPTGNLITSTTSGNIPPTGDYVNGDWEEVSATFNTSFTSFTVRLSNLAEGGLGNDLAIDDIFVYQTLCDLDGDGVEDSVDLDNDDDGIPNVVELQLSDDDKDGTVNNDSGAFAWVDANNNGLIDIYDHQDINGNNPSDAGFTVSLGVPIDLTDPKYDTDGDGVADYLDLDSDNDGIFDTVEYDNRGDVDADGDGNGDGSDKQILDISGNPIDNDDFDGDGILTLADNNDDDADGSDHGTANAYPTPLDDDGDGIPNFRDVDSGDNPNDFSNGSDIDTIEIYAHLDANNDGVLDDTVDSDGDGILDIFDTDNNVFGSPRDLSDSYTLFFDGRNDYVEDANVINAWANASLMAWIKIEPGATGERVVVGQNSFRISITNGGVVKAEANGVTLEDTEVLQENIWVHVGATYNSGLGEYVLYVNGHPVRSTSVSGSFSADASNFTIGRTPNTDTYYFQGEIDEVRLFNEALSETAFQRMVYQELSSASFNQGAIVPLDIDAANTFNTSLIRYFKMDTFKGDIVDDAATLTIDVGTGAKLYNIKNIYFQTAPLPYETTQLGDWSDKATWLHGDVWDIDNEATNQDWSIVHVKHDLTTANRHGTVGLIVDAAAELSIQGDIELYNSWYLNLAGLIDLEGESQLVQTPQSVLEASGSIERDQQGTENLYTYNYWSSPVHSVNPNTAVDGDETYTVASVLKDGEDPDNPAAISFVGGYDGDNTSSPIEIANYWIWKFEDNLFSNYYAWQQIKSTGVLKVGEGYTMKGPGTGSIATDKNYVFEGKPNNGIIELPINAGNASLVGNPYPSAIDANQFIADNTHLDGALYFWEHYGGGSHILKEYQGGYATYNLSGGAPAVASVGVDQVNGTATKIPAQFVPVGQGFYVKANSNGDVTFNNGQRVFMTEASSSNSLFVRGTAQKSTVATTDTSLEDLRTKFRVNYNSPNGYVRQLLTTIDENASIELDRGYDASLIEEGAEDMFWMIGENSYVIQGIDQPAETTTLPLSVKTKTAGEIVISLAELKYPTEGFELYLKDNLTETYHDLLENPTYTTSVEQGITANRFEIVFAKQVNTLSVSDNEIAQNAVGVYYDNTALHITNPNNASIEKITGNNILGQSVLNEVINSSDKNITLPANLALGIYIFTIETDHSTITKKMIIN